MALAYLISVFLSISFGLIEVASCLRNRATLEEGAGKYWVGRVIVDGGGGALGVAALGQIHSPPWSDPVLTGVVAGLSAPSLLRQTWTHVNDLPIGLATAYDYVRKYFDLGIRRAASERDSKWIEDEVIPDLVKAQVEPKWVGGRLVRWASGEDLEGVRRLDIQATIKANVEDPVATDEKKIEVLIDLALELKAFRTIENMHDTAKKKLASEVS